LSRKTNRCKSNKLFYKNNMWCNFKDNFQSSSGFVGSNTNTDDDTEPDLETSKNLKKIIC